MAQRVLIIEDDKRLADMVAVYLTQNEFDVVHSGTASEGLDRLLSDVNEHPFAIVLLDIMLPDGNGLDVCRQIRTHTLAANTVPIVMLTAKGDTMDRVVGLELGADDYIAKPFEPRELLARMRAVLRRPRTAATTLSNALRFGDLEIDRDARALRLRGDDVLITSYQFNLLLAMAERPGRVLSRQLLMDLLKGEALELYDRSIDVHIGRLRMVIEDDPKKPKRIITVRGAGYVFARSQDASPTHE
ncbi:MAG: response regulator transcription factor [Arenimonas sp.]